MKEEQKRILGISDKKKDGECLPMKQSGKLEAQKSKQQQRNEMCNFIKNAFCVNGDVKLVVGRPKQIGIYYEVNDKERGKFTVDVNQVK